MDKSRKKELQSQYAETKIPKGVYSIRNVKNGKSFVASSPNLNGAKNANWFTLGFGSHMNKELQREWKEYGESSFEFLILEIVEEKEDQSVYEKTSDRLKKLEAIWLEKLQPYEEKGYHGIRKQ